MHVNVCNHQKPVFGVNFKAIFAVVMAFEISTIAFLPWYHTSEMRNLHSYHANLAANKFDAAQADLFFFYFTS